MNAKNYRQILNARGYREISNPKYKGLCVFEKEHRYNRIECWVEKDPHGKGVGMTFKAYSCGWTGTIEKFKEAEFDRRYLVKEALAIHEAFEKLKAKKSPKSVACF